MFGHPWRGSRVCRAVIASALFVVPGCAEEEAPGLPGRDLLAPDAERLAATAYFRTDPPTSELARVGGSDGAYKYLRVEEDEYLYQLPDEEANLAESEPGRAAMLRSSLDALLAGMAPAPEPSTPRLSEARRQRLEALGYAVDE